MMPRCLDKHSPSTQTCTDPSARMLFVSSLALTSQQRRGSDRTRWARKTLPELLRALHLTPRYPPVTLRAAWLWVCLTGSLWARLRQQEGRKGLNPLLGRDTYKAHVEIRPIWKQVMSAPSVPSSVKQEKGSLLRKKAPLDLLMEPKPGSRELATCMGARVPLTPSQWNKKMSKENLESVKVALL